ncbi:MAG TPA: amidoligase family protein, partial [Myxococcota bacterium]|nr:amidoligase family protein [Myxococcota bacterium]
MPITSRLLSASSAVCRHRPNVPRPELRLDAREAPARPVSPPFPMPEPTTVPSRVPWGGELELKGLSLPQAARAVARGLGTRDVYACICGNTFGVRDQHNRMWLVKPDSTCDAEVNTPIMDDEEDLPALQSVAASVAQAGGKVDPTTGVHFHKDTEVLMPVNLLRVVANLVRHEAPLYRALHVLPNRSASTCQPMEPRLVNAMIAARPECREEMEDAYTEARGGSRYRGINLENLWDTLGTLEYRYFNGTLCGATIGHYLA